MSYCESVKKADTLSDNRPQVGESAPDLAAEGARCSQHFDRLSVYRSDDLRLRDSPAGAEGRRRNRVSAWVMPSVRRRSHAEVRTVYAETALNRPEQINRASPNSRHGARPRVSRRPAPSTRSEARLDLSHRVATPSRRVLGT